MAENTQKTPKIDDHLRHLDAAIEEHGLVDIFAEQNIKMQAPAPLPVEEKSISLLKKQMNLTDEEKRKEKLIKSLEKELLYLGFHEGKVVECGDIMQNRSEGEKRGTLRKRIKNGLIMEYTFSSQAEGIQNFHLNNVEIDLNDMPDDKLAKLYIIIRYFNSVYRIKRQEIKEKKLTDEELKKQKAERELAAKRKMVLGKL
jgi:hypothetical protein